MRGNVAVVVSQTKGNRYHVHRILKPDGSKFVFEEKKNAEPTSSNLKSDNTLQGKAIGSTPKEIIAENYDFVNMDEDYFTAVELGDKSLLRDVVGEALETTKMSLTDSSELIIYDDNGDIVPLSKRLYKDDDTDYQFLGDENAKAKEFERKFS